MSSQKLDLSTVSSCSSSSGTYAFVVDMDNCRLRRYPSVSLKKSKGRKLRLARVACVVSVISLLIAVSVSVWVLLVSLTNWPSSLAETDRTLCLPCEYVTYDPSDRSWLKNALEVRRDHNGSVTCCATTKAQYLTLLQLSFRSREKKEQEHTDPWTQTKPPVPSPPAPQRAVSAHLLFRRGLGSGQRQQWSGPNETHLSHVTPGLRFYDNSLYVVTPGVYYVYAQFLFDVDLEGGPHVVSGYVYRDSVVLPPISGILLKARHTRLGGDRDFHVSHVGGLFQLQAGDQLYVRTSNTTLVSNDERGSFFGLFRIGD
ncbi:tumor necrosis factor ligand superfamily member 10-like [Pomacea canaliculata]|uniref:tumor necrosis factor ligand superfamily member 10-like n=1 Tax=Pomacea canaliculata TaxID=400727 RepID=UPI000D72C306|nr:tumor necrosis factor ligand superfamily member 10-like [Pomacea canaliculata]